MKDTETRFTSHTEIRDTFALKYPNHRIRVIGELPDGRKAGNAWVIVAIEFASGTDHQRTIKITAHWV